MRTKTLLVAMSSILYGTAAANDQAMGEGANETARQRAELEIITVRAFPVDRSKLESTQPVQVLAGEALDDRRGLTLGETLQREPGVHSTFYGRGAARPIIRGFSGPRVKILENNLGVIDVADQSDDHAVSVDPMLVDQIEILRGPSALLYGAGAVGGVVNLVDNRIPERAPEQPLTGAFELRGDTVSDERSGAARLDGGGGGFAWHLDGTWRDTDDYDIAGRARIRHEDDHDDHDDHDDEGGSGTLENSFVENQSWTGGASWVGDRGFIGASYRQFESQYGIPAPHSHGAHDDEHDDHGDQADEFAFIDMKQQRWDVAGGLNAPMPGIRRATVRMSHNDYRHAEVELGDDDHDDHDEHAGHDGTRFDVEAYQARLEFQTEPLAGWSGAIGLQFEDIDFDAVGGEAFISPNDTRSLGVFVFQERSFSDLTVSLGGRFDGTRIERTGDLGDHDEHEEHDDHDGPDAHADAIAAFDERSFRTWSASAGAVWQIDDQWQASLNFARNERAPAASELLANGPHLATFSFDQGDPALRKETTQAWDLGVHRHSEQLELEVTVFHRDIKDFVFLEDSITERDGLPLRVTRQDNAEFYGLEAQAIWAIEHQALGEFDFRAGYDITRASVDGGDDLPRISPQRFTAGVDWFHGPWRGAIEWQHVFEQDRTAPLERSTSGYDMVNLRLSYTVELERGSLELFAQGNNLADENARVHTSFLRDFAPLPGRNLVFGLRGRF